MLNLMKNLEVFLQEIVDIYFTLGEWTVLFLYRYKSFTYEKAILGQTQSFLHISNFSYGYIHFLGKKKTCFFNIQAYFYTISLTK